MTQPATSRAINVAVVLLTVATATIHIMIGTPPIAQIQKLFLVNAAGYLILLVALVAPGPQALHNARPMTRLLLLAWTIGTILAWLLTGLGRTPIGYAAKLIELVLVVLLVAEVVRARRAAT